MASKNSSNQSNYYIIAAVELDLSKVQKQLDGVFKNKGIKIDVDTGNAANEMKNIEESVKKADSRSREVGLTWQQNSAIFRRSVDIIESLFEKVINFDTALTEMKKVSDLSGNSLDSYVDKLADLGTEVSRTGKPLVSSLSDGMVNQH